ncbi:MAG: acyl CoA:acetate/3-ketoacid CoA transferase [bacterium]
MALRDHKVCSADDAISHIQSGMTIVSGGFVGAAHPEALTSALERRFKQTGMPKDLTLVYGAGQGDGHSRGLNHLAHQGLLKRVIGGHWGLAPGLGRLAIENKIEGYNFPQGVICQLLRDIAAGRPGCITHVGLGTFVDPELSGGRLNAITTEPMVERIEIGHQNWLFYKSFPIHIGLIRATAADIHGGLIMNNEAILGEALPIAQAVHNSGGIVIAQVQDLMAHPAAPQHVRVPGIYVDHIVLANPGEHDQTFAEYFNPAYCNSNSEHSNYISTHKSFTFNDAISINERHIIASRACDELTPGSIANLGIGMPEGIAQEAALRGILGTCTLTIESGPIGGKPAGGLSFGASAWPHAIIDQAAQFDFYDGGGLDFAALGAAQIDRLGNVNVSRFGQKFAGIGGFVNISQNARKVVFCGTLTAGNLKTSCEDGKLKIIQEGKTKKFVKSVEQIGFSCDARYRRSKEVLYITERAVFRLMDEGLELIEIAPGIEIEKDILPQMEFRPLIKNVKPMPSHCFTNTIQNRID